jgi:hypothetical protein
MHKRRRIAACVAGFGTAALVLTAATASGARPAAVAVSGSRQPAGHPTAIWEASLEGVHGTSPDVTVRELARVSVDASGIRVRLGNPSGTSPVTVRDAWLGLPIARVPPP